MRCYLVEAEEDRVVEKVRAVGKRERKGSKRGQEIERAFRPNVGTGS
jgi:hypothetical protein